MKIPFVDLKGQYRAIQDEIEEAIRQVFEETAFAGGPFVAKFEGEFARFCGSSFAIGVGSGTEAIFLALLALGVSNSDEVITVPNTFIATAEAVSWCGAKPVFVDIDERTYNMDPALLEAAVNPRTKAVIPVHLFGQMADMDPIMEIARKHGLFVIEDACQAHGAVYQGRRAGSIGDAGCFSFYPGKNLGAYGEAGAIVTDDQALADKIKVLRDHGQPQKYFHRYIGLNARMDGLQGAILSVKLKHLPRWNEARRKHAERYCALLSGIKGVTTPGEAAYGKHVYHIYAIRVQDREGMVSFLLKNGIGCGIHYPVPIHLQEAYHFLGLKEGSFPAAERCAKELISLPLFPELGEEQIKLVAETMGNYVAKGSREKF